MRSRLKIAGAILFMLLIPAEELSAQKRSALRDSLRKNNQRILIFSGFAGIAQPGADLSNDYGTFGQAGGGIEFINKSGFTAGIEGAYLFGSGVKKDPIPNLRNPDLSVTGSNGSDAVFKVYQRGTLLPVLRFGYRIKPKIPFFRNNIAGGPTLNLSLGWFRHFTFIEDISKKTAQFSQQYRPGYDRLVTGVLPGVWVGYLYIPEQKGLNLHLEIGYGTGFTKTARYSFSDGTPPGISRKDNLFQARLKICFTVRSRAENTVYYY